MAYGFFKPNATRQAVGLELPRLMEMASVPRDVRMTLKTVGELQGGPSLMELKREAIASNAGDNLVIEAAWPSMNNKKTADEVAAVFRQAYWSTGWYKRREKFYGNVFYEENGAFLALEA